MITKLFPSGTYRGQLKNNVAHGKGTFTSGFKGKYKYFYEGDWVNGKRHGKGKQIINLPKWSLKYQGDFKNDDKEGRGVATHMFKGKLYEKYVGQFKVGFHGKGKLINYKEKWTKQGRFVKGSFKK